MTFAAGFQLTDSIVLDMTNLGHFFVVPWLLLKIELSEFHNSVLLFVKRKTKLIKFDGCHGYEVTW